MRHLRLRVYDRTGLRAQNSYPGDLATELNLSFYFMTFYSVTCMFVNDFIIILKVGVLKKGMLINPLS